MYNESGVWKEISFDEAFELIYKNLSQTSNDEVAFFAGARLTNEEMYLIRKLAEKAVNTKNKGSFLYLGRGNGYAENSFGNVPFEEIQKAEHIYIMGTEINYEHPVVGYMIFNHQHQNRVPVTQITTDSTNRLDKKVNNKIGIKSYYYFAKAVNHYLLSANLQNQLFIGQNTAEFDNYKNQLLSENYDQLIEKAGVAKTALEAFAREYNETNHAIIIYSEKRISANASLELRNMAMITGKLGKTAMGLISLKEKNNAEGLFNLGFGEGVDEFNKISHLNDSNLLNKIEEGKIKNYFIFGENPLGTAKDKAKAEKWLSNASFVVVQDYFMTETAQKANLVLPASLPYETGGSFTNAQRTIQAFEKQKSAPFEYCNVGQLLTILKHFNINHLHSVEDVSNEIHQSFSSMSEMPKATFRFTSADNDHKFFCHGCDSVNMQFNHYFDKKLNKTKEYESIQ